MRIGYSVEDSTTRAVLEGLRRRWCPQAALVEGRFRGTTMRRDIPKICIELFSKGVSVAILLRDANLERWREVLAEDEKRAPKEHRHATVFGVCDRNVESWLLSEPNWFAKERGRNPDEFRGTDHKKSFESSMGIVRGDRKEDEIARLVENAPLRDWLSNESFSDFYEDLRRMSKRLSCAFENLRESTAG